MLDLVLISRCFPCEFKVDSAVIDGSGPFVLGVIGDMPELAAHGNANFKVIPVLHSRDGYFTWFMGYREPVLSGFHVYVVGVANPVIGEADGCHCLDDDIWVVLGEEHAFLWCWVVDLYGSEFSFDVGFRYLSGPLDVGVAGDYCRCHGCCHPDDAHNKADYSNHSVYIDFVFKKKSAAVAAAA